MLSSLVSLGKMLVPFLVLHAMMMDKGGLGNSNSHSKLAEVSARGLPERSEVVHLSRTQGPGIVGPPRVWVPPQLTRE